MEFILYFRSEDVPISTYLLFSFILDSEDNLAVTRDGIVHLSAVEANQTEFTTQLLFLLDEETS